MDKEETKEPADEKGLAVLTLDEKIRRYQHARAACELARNLLRELPLDDLLKEINLSESVGPIFHPTAWREKSKAMLEDRDVFAAARRFLGTWPK